MPTIGAANAPARSGSARPAIVPPDAAPHDVVPFSAAPTSAVLTDAAPTAARPSPPGGTGPVPPPPRKADVPPAAEGWSPGSAPDEAGRADDKPATSDDGRNAAAESRPLSPPRSTGTTATKAAPATPRDAAKRRPAWPLTVVGVVVAVAAGIALVFALARTDPADLAATAATEAGGWPGARYQGAVAAIGGGVIEFDLTVTADGASGTLSRDGGRATAELLGDSSGTLMRANREWWLYQHPTRADDLADAWVAEPLTETREIDPVLRLHPAALAEHVRGGSSTQWAAIEQQMVDGRPAVVLSDGARRVVIGRDGPHALLAVDVAPGSSTAPVLVGRAADGDLTAVHGAAARVRQEAAPRTLAQLLLERPQVAIQLQPEPLCTTETCNVTVTVTNAGTAPARGRLEISADGKIVAEHPLDVYPGQVATFTAAAPNPQFAQPGATGQILWESRAIDD
jgi:hypothetical protein